MDTSQTQQQAWLNLMNAGKRSFQQGKFTNAVQAFNSAAKLFPERVEAWINLGSALQEAKGYGAAAVALKKAVSLNPDIMVSHMILGDALRMLGQWREAFACYHNAVALERSPLSLNKLASALRTQGKLDFAEGLYREAIDLDPNFTLARLNLAMLQIDRCRYDQAEEQMRELSILPLPPFERRELEYSQSALSEYRRLNKPITALAEGKNSEPLETALRSTPSNMQEVDDSLLESIQRYAESAKYISNEVVTIDNDLPAEWPLIEAMFMVPLVKSVSEFQQIREKLKTGIRPTTQQQVSFNMEPAIRAARACQADMLDPVKAELHLRHWHLLACSNVDGFSPGHFKYTQNGHPSDPAFRRVEPALASATFRRFVTDIYSKLQPGYARAAVLLMAIADLHLFADGNSRIALTWINRELEWAGLMPAIFNQKLGFKGELGAATVAVRTKGNDLSPIITVLNRAQKHAVEFCAELSPVK